MLLKNSSILAVGIALLLSSDAFAGKKHRGHNTDETSSLKARKKQEKLEKKLKKKGKIFYTDAEIQAEYQKSLAEVKALNEASHAEQVAFRGQADEGMRRFGEESDARMAAFRQSAQLEEEAFRQAAQARLNAFSRKSEESMRRFGEESDARMAAFRGNNGKK